jgi:4'-phosphopantetheinyl transferase
MNDNIRWHTPSTPPLLAVNEVHVWRARLFIPHDEGQSQYAAFMNLLSDEEKNRAQQFRFEKHRQPWIIAHAYLRILLSIYLHISSTHIALQQNEYGKPSLSSPAQSSLHFNLSHSNELALYAFTLEREVGVDVEYMRQNISHEEVARHSFSPYEQQVLLALPPEERFSAFYRCWTRKEAYIKARGMGLSLPLHLFDVSLEQETSTALLASREDPREVGRWSMRNLQPGVEYAGALMAEGNDWQIRCWECSPTMITGGSDLWQHFS